MSDETPAKTASNSDGLQDAGGAMTDQQIADLFGLIQAALDTFLGQLNSDATKGGASSGNWAHRGLPGKRGGSAPGTGGLGFIGVQPGTDRANIKEAADAAKRRRKEQDDLRAIERELMAELGDNDGSGGIRPTGRAPRGQGAEYQARNWVADRIDYFERQLGNIDARKQRSRGTRRDRAANTDNNMRRAAIEEAIGTARAFAAGILGSDGTVTFLEEKAFFQQIFAMPTAMMNS